MLDRKCKAHLKTQIQAQKEQEKSLEKAKQSEIKIDKGFSM
jgi:hypothetical protein